MATSNKRLCKSLHDSKVKLQLMGSEYDQAEVHLTYRLRETKRTDPEPLGSGGMVVNIRLPEGSIVAGPAEAERRARHECAQILLAMARQVRTGVADADPQTKRSVQVVTPR